MGVAVSVATASKAVNRNAQSGYRPAPRPYSRNNRNKPSLPRAVCLGPRIALSVPVGITLRLSRTVVNRVRSANVFLSQTPCGLFLTGSQPSAIRSLMSCFPV